MVKKSILKRASYFGSALILMLAAIPVLPSGRVWADASELANCLASTAAKCTLQGDEVMDSLFTLDRDLTIDLNGHKISSSNTAKFFEVKGHTLNIVGSGSIVTTDTTNTGIIRVYGTDAASSADSTKVTIGQNVTLSGPNPVVVYNNNGTAYNTQIDIYGTLNGQNSGIWMIGTIANKANYPIVNIHDGAVISANNTDSTAVSAMGYAEWNIGGATITGTGSGVGIKAGIVNIDGATVKGVGNPGVLPPATYENGINPSGAAIQIEKNAGYAGDIELNIGSGAFTSDYNDAVYAYGTADSIKSVAISGGTFSSPTTVLEDVASGKAVWNTGYNKYEVLEASDAKDTVNGWMLAKVGTATPIANMSERVKNYSDFKVVGNGTFENGAYTPAEAGKYNYIRVFPRVCKDDGGNVTCGKNVAENNYEATIRISTYGINEINEVLPVGGESQIPENAVIVKSDQASYTYSVEDSNVATVDADGKITAVKSGTTKVYATITGQGNTSVQEEIGTVYVYDFNSIEDNYLIKKGGRAKVLADDAWDLTATTTSQNVNIVKNGNNFRINGVSAGLAEVKFAATIGGEEKSKTAKAYVYEVNGQDVVVKKGATVSESEIGQLINKGHNDVTMRVKKIDNEAIATNDGLVLTGVEAGETVATYRLTVGDNGAHANVPINVHVWDFVTENLVDVYDLGDLQTVTDTFKVYDNGGEISYTVKDESGAEVDDVVVNLNGDEYTVTKADDARAGEYLIKFTDKVMGEEVASKTIAVRVHEIVTTGEDENYIVMTRNPFAAGGNRYELNVTELSGYSRNRDITATVSAATSLGGVTTKYRHGGNWRITANAAGSYDVTFSDGIASKTIHVYVMQFTFGQDSYHVRREDGAAGELINAINNYWHDENVANGYTDTEFVIVNDETGAEVASGYGVSKTVAPLPPEGEEYGFKWCINDECLPAGNYTITFKAYANNKQGQATKNVRLHIYEMTAPQKDLYFMGIGDQTTIIVDDANERASTRAEIVSGPEGGLEFQRNGWGIFATTDYSKLNARLSGVYTVRYTDYMGNGGIVGTYEATIVVIEQKHEELFVRRGESLTITGNTDWGASFATDSTTGVDYVAEGGEIEFDTTGMELGEHIVRIAHDFVEFDDGEFPPREMIKTTAVVVYEVTGDAGDDMNSDVDRVSVANFVASKIATMLENNSTDDDQVLIWSDIDGLKDLLRSGANIETGLETRLLDKDEWEDAEARDEILKIVDENGIVAMYEVYLVIYADDNEIGLIYELDDEITMRLEILEKYRTVADGYTRTFSVVRGHVAMDDNETAEAINATRDGDYLVFKNKKFSSFAISYTDALIPAAPDTGFVVSNNGSASTSNLVAAITTLIGAITLAGAAVFAKRK